MTKSHEEALLELERGFWSAAGDGSFYADHMADEGICLLPVGRLDKAATIEATSDASPWLSFSLEDVLVRRMADDVSVIAYRATGRRPGAEPYHALASSLYQRSANQWRLSLHQQTPLPD